MSHPVVEFPGHAAPIRDHVGPQRALVPFAQAGKAGGHPRKNLARAGVEPAVRQRATTSVEGYNSGFFWDVSKKNSRRIKKKFKQFSPKTQAIFPKNSSKFV